uniref:Transmembrane protein 132C n=1 Tax=Trichogramma kaykai TaxID=54128 RepID=A0ABD2W4F5_9HYME
MQSQSSSSSSSVGGGGGSSRSRARLWGRQSISILLLRATGSSEQKCCSRSQVLHYRELPRFTNVAASVEVHFESKDGGFFLKHSPRQYYPSNVRPDLSLSSIFSTTSASTSASGSSSSSSSSSSSNGQQQAASSVLSVDKFTVFQTSEPVSVRATYGPFSTKQTVPARYIVPDPLDVLPAQNFDGKKAVSSSNATLRDVQEIGARHLDMSAHVVSSSIPRDSPVLRVLFHAGSEATGRRQLLLGRQQRVCVLLHATPSIVPRAAAEAGSDFVSGPLTAACTPDGQDGVCLAQITIPASWWPPLPPPDSAGRVKLVKTLPRTVQLSYSVLEPRGPEDSGSSSSSSQGSSHHTLDSGSGSSAASSFCQPRVQIQPITPLGQVTLVPNRATYKELKTDEYLTLLVPHGPLYPRSRLHIPVFLQSHSSKQATQGRPPVAAVVLRARVKAGVKILDASTSSPDWIVETDINTKNTAATFTARRKENISRLPNASAEEIMTMLLEASEESAESKEHGGGGRIVWSVRYALEGEEDNVSLSGPFQLTQPHQQQQMQQQQQQQQYQQQQPLQHHHHHNGPSDRKKLQAHLEIQKDDIQAVLPISKNWEVINTAVLTGRQISQAMKVFIVSQAGTVADVTLQSSCHSEDESVLKVSSSCSSVYVDGSEIRGSSNASVLVKYGTYTGLARFTVWMPEFPLEVSVVDTRLNQIKGWKVPEDNVLAKNKRSSLSSDLNSIVSRADAKKPSKIKKRSAALGEQPQMATGGDKDDEADYEDEDEEEEEDDEDEEGEDEVDEPEAMGAGSGKMRFRSADKWDEINAIDRSSASSSCRLRFQQSPVEVHARFLAADHDSGRVSYFVNRRTWLRVTDLVAGLLRVSDPRIATLLQGRIVQGRGIGRTEVQVLSPITGRVIGAREVRVGNDRVAITQLSVKVVSGLQLSITPDSAIENGYVAETSVTRKLTAQYQEGLLDIDIEFSDGARTPLREIAVSNYQLVVESLDPDVVAFAPMAASHHPRVIAVGEGRGELLRVSLQLADACRTAGRRGKSSSSPQARASTASSSSSSSAASSSSASSNVATPLASATANVEVDFASSDSPSRPEFVQNDGGGNLGLSAHHRERKAGNREMAPDLQDILIGMGGVGIRPNTDHHMTPLEIGMYVLLAAFCFAIVVFVGACVVYASKLKPVSPTNSDSAALPVLEAARAAASQFASNHNLRPNRQPRESTTNAHDWVWLGRATLERAACAPQQVRVTSNPLAAEPEEEALNSFDNPHHVELPPARSSSSASAPIDSTTYCKRDRQHRGLSSKSSARSTSHLRDNGNNETAAPPLPPHKISSAMSDNGNEDYKPPVPPHRGSRLMPETPKRHRHHHHQRAASSSSNNAAAATAAPASNPSNGSDHHMPRSRHESSKHHHHRSKSGRSRSSSNSAAVSNDLINDKDKNSNADEIFVEGRSRDVEIRHKRGRSRESKRATVVGNPMFVSSDSTNNSSSGNTSQNDNNQQQQQPQQETSASSIIAPTTGGSTLDELNLDMDYNQIMQYFDNLKESNA